MNTSWRTTTTGIVTVLIAVCNFVLGMVNNTPVDIATTIAAITSGLGLVFARDNKVTSEDVGVK